MGHDPADRLRAMGLAQDYGKELYTGVFYRNPNPGPTYESLAKERREQLSPVARPKEQILEMFIPE
jgi:2-oxoglutarate ferredoxin oxidoreductase subunit beta